MKTLFVLIHLLLCMAYAGGTKANHLAVFYGATVHDGHPAHTLGLDYEYHMNKQFGFISLAEYIAHEEAAGLFGGGLAYHPFGGAKLALIPALEMNSHHSAFVLRTNLEWAFHFDQYSASPSYSLDLVEGHAVNVFGLAFGAAF